MLLVLLAITVLYGVAGLLFDLRDSAPASEWNGYGGGSNGIEGFGGGGFDGGGF